MNDSTSSPDFTSVYTYPERIVAVVLLCLILVFGTFGNTMVIVAVFLSRKLQTRTNVFVVSLSVADLLYCLALFPTICALAGENGWPFPRHEWLCKFGAFLLFTCGGVSIYTLSAIAMNRMILITHPSRYLRIFSPKKLLFMIGITWCVPALVILLPPLVNLGGLGYDAEDTTCTDLDQHKNGDIYNLIQASFLYPGPLLLITVGYSRTFWYINRHFKRRRNTVKKQPSASFHSMTECSNDTLEMDFGKRERRALRKRRRVQEIQITKNLFLVVAMFTIFYSPYFMSLFIPGARYAVLYTGVVAAANSVVNPIIYSLKHPHFNVVLKAMIRCRYNEIPDASINLSRVFS